MAFSTGGVLSSDQKASKSEDYEIIGPRQLRQVDQLLTRIERKSEARSASPDKLLRSVS